MYILIEEYQYNVTDIKPILHGIDALESIEGKVSVSYVGYFYNTLLKDCVFILPKVILKEDQGKERVFGKYLPEQIADIKGSDILDSTEKDFLYKFAVWIYRAIIVFKNDKKNDSSIIFHTHIAQIGNGKTKLSNTYLDILLSLLSFSKENQNFFLYAIKNIHSGFNKINWTKTIATQTAFIQDNHSIYLNPVNKKRKINFDEELFVIYFSILNYISECYGFPKIKTCNYEVITGKRFDSLLNGQGKKKLLQIKYKYFSDKALQLWKLCFAFFDEAKQIRVSSEKKEYLLVKNFYIVFEAIIDELIGDNPLPDGMDKKMEDGKILDHLFTARSLFENEHKQTYYIGDSKYYKMGHELGAESIYKQYTYARNVIQWNLDIFNNGHIPQSGIQVRDELTEGYNILPNFFISSKLNEELSYTRDDIEKTDRIHNKHKKVHFKNRLFDRDTLLLFHYDVNFLFVLSLYARNNKTQKVFWKTKIRNKFRKEIQEWLQDDYDFYVMHAMSNVNAEEYISSHFKQLVGKIYLPFEDKSIFSLALDKDPNFEESNRNLVEELKNYFYLEPCNLNDDPNSIFFNTP